MMTQDEFAALQARPDFPKLQELLFGEPPDSPGSDDSNSVVTPANETTPHRSLSQALIGREPLTDQQIVEQTADELIPVVLRYLLDTPERFWKAVAIFTSDAVQHGRPKTALSWSGTEKQLRDFIQALETELQSIEFRSALIWMLTERFAGQPAGSESIDQKFAGQLSDLARAILKLLANGVTGTDVTSKSPLDDAPALIDAVRELFQRECDDEREKLLVSGLTNKDKPNPPDDSASVTAKMVRESAVTLLVDVPKQRATLQTAKSEEPFDLPSEGVARWLKVLADHPDEWIRPDDYETHGGVDLQGLRPRDKLRTLDTKCPRLGRLIATSKHDGMRFEPEWALNSGRAPRCATNR